MGVISTCTDKYQTCIDECNRCSQACHECIKLCLNEPDVSVRKDHIAQMMECAGVCKEAACLMSSDSKHAREFCQLCATICDECSTSCAKFKDDHCQKCAAECKKCADTCRSM
ncbi:MAG: four-helix bundle copper-binding protein [Oscillospiraceae bacterium]|nr:four-helix bundle copper-binding protein [Oscillospiraceae bacterium]MCI2036159.1 four-helix bundle copper-binding protein [Oscillospiraceae bacterium]